jgi:hypothetical protein
MKVQEAEPLWVRPRRAIQMIDCGMTKFYELMANGRVETKKVDGMRLVSVASLKKLGEAA